MFNPRHGHACRHQPLWRGVRRVADEQGRPLILNRGHIAKLLVIAFPAALAAWLTAFGLLSSEHSILSEQMMSLLGPALIATLLIGFPVSALVFHFSGRKLAASFETYAMTVVLTCVMLVLSAWWVAGRAGVIALGLPSVAAALTYAVLGWFWVVRPMRNPNP